jgi:KaiC/GvpD/RAD55 family RecA-like ATPase
MGSSPLTAERIYSSAETLNASPPEGALAIRKVPTGIADLDSIVDGGFPEGSLVLLLGDIGAGMQEYVYTAGSKIAIVRQHPEFRRYFLGGACDDSVLPEKICYATFSRSREAVLQELGASFNGEFYYAFRDLAHFKDFSATYFRNSVVPASWTQQEGAFGSPSENILESLVTFLDEEARGSLVVIDSLTDLVEAEAVEMKDLVTTVKGLQRASKDWGGVTYLLLTRGILEKRYEQMVIDSVDGCLTFEWRSYLNSSKRQRYMYVEKFTSVLPHLNRDKIARFPTMVTSAQGLVVVYMERIS